MSALTREQLRDKLVARIAEAKRDCERADQNLTLARARLTERNDALDLFDRLDADKVDEPAPAPAPQVTP
jgi:hypothetical protein